MVGKKRRSIVMGDKTWNQLKQLAKKEERSISGLLREAALDLLNKRKKAGTYNPETDSYQS